MNSREAHIVRNTTETQIDLWLQLDGSGSFDIHLPEAGGAAFWKHMLEQWAKHGGFDLRIRADGDVAIDGHHLMEDLGIVLGQALLEALGDKRGIARYGFFIAPMDETLLLCAVDFCGRPYLQLDWHPQQARVGDFDVALAREFMVALSNSGRFNLHLRELSGGNAHHMLEAGMKAMAKAMRAAVMVSGTDLPTTKGVL